MKKMFWKLLVIVNVLLVGAYQALAGTTEMTIDPYNQYDKPKEMESSFKKYYCIDTGLLSSKKTTTTGDFGRMLENAVAIELKRKGHELYYYMVDDKYAVDFVIAEMGTIREVIQVVNDDEEIPEREIRTGILACNRLKCKKLKIITWNKAYGISQEGIDVEYIPLWKFLTMR